MQLWNLIRDFYVQYIFGGWTSRSVAVSNGYLGYMRGVDSSAGTGNTSNTYVPVGTLINQHGNIVTHITMGDWLSTTFTIITLIVFVCILFIFLRWLFKVVSGLILLKN